ncbi:MAG: hydroxymethylbilane synthase [Flavisolibacter sp.]|nr:hydroxymethylbilane synthase [Flavisolibacter sp.]
MQKVLRIGTRDSQLAVWQATLVQSLLKEAGVLSELVYMKSEGDIDTVTPLYALGVTGVFTKTLDAALLSNRIDIAVHSMKDVPVQLARGIQQAAVLKRASHKDLFIPHPALKNAKEVLDATASEPNSLESAIVATSSVRRIAQWKRRYPHHTITNLRGNVNTRLRKLGESNWVGAIFAAAGLERIDLRPSNAIELDWMLPAPAQGAIMVVCREKDDYAFQSCQSFNNEETALCTKIERDFLSGLMGGCSTPISALAEIIGDKINFKGNIVSPDGSLISETEISLLKTGATDLGFKAAKEVMNKGGKHILDLFRNKGLTTNGEV